MRLAEKLDWKGLILINTGIPYMAGCIFELLICLNGFIFKHAIVRT
jgi:hypothetical protein